MATSVERVGGIAAMPPLAYAAAMYVGHALMMSGVLGLEHGAHYLHSIGLPAWLPMTTGELAGGALLLTGVYVRHVAIALTPLLVGAGLLHLATGIGASIGFALYFGVTLAGQGLLAGWTAPAAPAEEQ